MTRTQDATAGNRRCRLARLAALAIALVAAGASAGDQRFFPIDSNASLKYKIRYSKLGALHSEDSAVKTISGVRLIGDSLLVRRVETDSAGIRREESDSCVVSDSLIACGQDIHHIAQRDGLQKAYKSYLQNAQTSYFAFDSSNIQGAGVGGGRREYYDARIGMIHSFSSTVGRIFEIQISKTLFEIDGRPYDGAAVADSLKNLFTTSAAPHRRMIPRKDAQDYFGLLRSGRDALGRPSASAGVLRLLE